MWKFPSPASLMAGRRLSLKQQLRSRYTIKLFHNLLILDVYSMSSSFEAGIILSSSIQSIKSILFNLDSYSMNISICLGCETRYKMYIKICQNQFHLSAVFKLNQLHICLQMLGGPDDGPPSVRPIRPSRRGWHRPPWPTWGLPRSRAGSSRPRHCGHLGKGVP